MDEIEFEFAWEGAQSTMGPWRHLHVVEFRGTEGISSLYRYEIVVRARETALEIDPEDLIRASATLRIATLTQPGYRFVHGMITEAEELGSIHGGMSYRLVLSPPLIRAMHRTRCRVFLEKTTREIIDAVLQGDPALQRADSTRVEGDDWKLPGYRPSREVFAWRVADISRIDDVAARPYCVQYNESDFAFVSRLLEEEGISYHFEHGTDICLLVLTDSDKGRVSLPPKAPLGPGILGRTVTTMKLGARLRPRKVSLLDYHWQKPALSMAVEESSGKNGGNLIDHEYPGRYTNAPEQGKPLALAKLERFGVEARYAVGEGSCRVLSAGTIFTLEHTALRYEGEYLITKVEVRGAQHGLLPATTNSLTESLTVPYSCTFECARRGIETQDAESRFRPARVTPKPRIIGTQTAFVTADPSALGAEIHVGGPPDAQIGCVRLRFHWDQDIERHAKEPTSCWVRVSQVFAGIGEGAVFHPRVGVEAIVDFEDGDPDRPIVVGRVYNGQNQPPTVVPTVSTFKTMTSPGGGSFNELTLDDTAGSQQIKLHTPKDWNSEVGDSRSETVGNNSTSTVGINRTESTGGERSTTVEGTNTEAVQADESITIGANRSLTIANNASESVGADRTLDVKGNHTTTVGAHSTHQVAGNYATTVDVDRTIQVKGNHTTTVGVDRTLTIDGLSRETIKRDRYIDTIKDHHETIGGKVKVICRDDRSLEVHGNAKREVRGNETRTVDGNETRTVGGTLKHTVTGDESHTNSANRTLKVTGKHSITVDADREIKVGGNHKTTVGADRRLSVEGSSYETVMGERHIDITKDHSETIKGKRTRRVEGDSAESIVGNVQVTCLKDRSLEVRGNEKRIVDGNFDKTVIGKETRTVKGNVTSTVQGNDTRTVDGNATLTVDGNARLMVGAALTQDVGGAIFQNVSGVIAQTVGGAIVQTVGGAIVQTVGGALVQNVGGALDCNAAQKMSFTVGDCTLTIDPDKVTITAGGSTLVVSSADGVKITSDNGELTFDGKKINLNA